MTDMSHPRPKADAEAGAGVEVEVDEFGGLTHLVPPGQDPELLLRIHAAFTAQLEPSNFIERMWVRDMAIQAARVEYLRMADCAVQRLVQEEDSAEAPASGEAPEQADTAEADDRSAPSDRKLGKAYSQHIALFAALTSLEQSVMFERDRVIRQYDTRTGVVRGYEDAVAALTELAEGRGGG